MNKKNSIINCCALNVYPRLAFYCNASHLRERDREIEIDR